MKHKVVDKIRQFNRFYLPMFDLLGNSYLGSDYSATEARVLFEVFTNDGCTASSIAKTMNIDKSYLSRVIREHEKRGYLYRNVSRLDGRVYELHLTKEGSEKTQDLINKSNNQIAIKTQKLSDCDCERMIRAIETITELLEESNESSAV